MGRFTTKITSDKKRSLNNLSDTSIAILSAGVGSRIKSYEPRSLIKIGNKTLLEHQICVISQCFDSPEIITVVGYRADKIAKKMRGSVRIVENQIHETTNTSESMRLAFNNSIKNNFLFMHGDLYFNPQTLKNIDYSKSFVIVDNKNMMDNKEVGLTIAGGNATIFSYGLKTKWCQIAYITGREIKILKNIFNKFDSTHKKMLSFEVLNKMISMGAVFKCYEPSRMSILEIDRIKDLSQ